MEKSMKDLRNTSKLYKKLCPKTLLKPIDSQDWIQLAWYSDKRNFSCT